MFLKSKKEFSWLKGTRIPFFFLSQHKGTQHFLGLETKATTPCSSPENLCGAEPCEVTGAGELCPWLFILDGVRQVLNCAWKCSMLLVDNENQNFWYLSNFPQEEKKQWKSILNNHRSEDIWPCIYCSLLPAARCPPSWVLLSGVCEGGNVD